MPIHFWIAIILILALGLTGCQTISGSPSLRAVCTGLIGPIHYNSTKLTSRRHAGPDLALDLKERNQVGRELRCPNY